MANPREYTCKLMEMVDNGIVSADAVMNAAMSYMSEDDVKDMIRANGWLDMFESEESADDEEEVEIIAGSAVTIEGVEYVAVPGPERWGCTECAGNNNRLCTKFPDCGTLVFVRKEKQ